MCDRLAKEFHGTQDAAPLVPRELQPLGSGAYRGKLPVEANVVERDWLIAEVLCREAEGLLFPKGGESGGSVGKP